jgi:hypothetical protein
MMEDEDSGVAQTSKELSIKTRAPETFRKEELYSQVWQNLNDKVQQEANKDNSYYEEETKQKNFYKKWKEIAKRAREGDDKAIEKVIKFKVKWGGKGENRKSKYRKKQESRIRVRAQKIEGAARGIGQDELFMTSRTPDFISWSAGLVPDKQPTSRLNSGEEIDWLDLQEHLRLPTAYQIYKTGQGHTGALYAGPSSSRSRKALTIGQHAAHKLRQEAIDRSSSPATAVMRAIQAELASTANYEEMEACNDGYDYKDRNMGKDEEWDEFRLEYILKRDGVKSYYSSFAKSHDFAMTSFKPSLNKCTPVFFPNSQDQNNERGFLSVAGMPTIKDINDNRAQYLQALGASSVNPLPNVPDKSNFSEELVDSRAALKEITGVIQRVPDFDNLSLEFSAFSLNSLPNFRESESGYYYNFAMQLLNEESYEEAVKLFRLAAKQGHANAQYNLGFSYAYGEGILQDEKEAINWLKLAAKQGHADAQAELVKLTSSIHDGIPLQFKDKSCYTRDNLHSFLNYLHEELRSYKKIEDKVSNDKFFLSAAVIRNLCVNRNHAPTKEYDNLWAALKITFKIEFEEWGAL